MNASQAQQRIQQLEDQLAQCAEYLRRLPVVPAHHAMARRCEAVLAERPEGALLTGRIISPAGVPVLRIAVDLAGRTACVSMPSFAPARPALVHHLQTHVLAVLTEGARMSLDEPELFPH